jgi:dolichyl-phosphate-mannose-protein mannosyltransferase
LDISGIHLRAGELSALRATRAVRASLALAVVLGASVAVLLLQPVRSPWWIFADADATYVASSANLMAGEHTFYLDHPGMPLQDLMASTFEVRYVLHKIFLGNTSPHEYAAKQMLDLDSSRIYWRTFAALFYLFGATAAFFVCRRLLGHWGYGLAGGLLWIGAPGLVDMSIQYRPDVLLAGLSLLVGYLIARAAQGRDEWLYALAALTLGFTVTVKMHAAGLLVPFVLALLLRPPAPGWPKRLADRTSRSLARHSTALSLLAAAWIALAVVFNVPRWPFDTYSFEHTLIAQFAIGFAAYLAVALAVNRAVPARGPANHALRRAFSPFAALLTAVLALGICLPGTLFVDDGLLMLVKIKDGLTGGGINEGVSRFSFASDQLQHWPLRQAMAVFVLAGIAALVGVARRDLMPMLWFSGAAMMGFMAAGRLGTVHYFAPSYVLSIPPALWLLRRPRGVGAAVAVAAVSAYVLIPQLEMHRLDMAARAAQDQEAYAAAAERIAQSLIKPGRVALLEPPTTAIPDVRWSYVVDRGTSFKPPYPYRFLPDTPTGLEIAHARGLYPAYYVGSLPLSIHAKQRLMLGIGGPYTVKPLREYSSAPVLGVLKLLRGPAIDRPYGHADAAYDPWTGYFKQEDTYYDLWGNELTNPVRRKYIASEHLWLDAFGDFWNAKGRLVKSDPSLRSSG